MAQLQEIFESFQCKICMNEYDTTCLPGIVCKNDHIICKNCFDRISSFLCPFCKERMRYIDYRQLFKIKQATKNVLERQRKFSSQILHLERRVANLKVDNTDLVKFKDVVKEAIGQSDIGFKLKQIPNKDGSSFDGKFEQLATKIIQGIKILNQKSKKVDTLMSQSIITQMKIQQITVQFQIQKNYSKDLFKQLHDLKGHMDYLNRQIQTLKAEIKILQREKDNLVQELQRQEDYHKDNIESVKRKEREYYDDQLKKTKQEENQRIEIANQRIEAANQKTKEVMRQCENLEFENKDILLKSQVLTTQITVLNNKIERQMKDHTTKYQRILSEKLSAQQECSRLKIKMQDKQAQLNKQIKTLQEQKVQWIYYKQQMLAKLKNTNDRMEGIQKRNQQLRQKIIANEATIAKLQIDNISLLKEKEKLEDKYISQLRLVRAKMIQLSKDFCERSKEPNKKEVEEENSQLFKHQLDKLKQKRFELNEQTNKNIMVKLQRLLASCQNDSNSQLGWTQVRKFKQTSKSSCKCLECKVQEISEYVAFTNKRVAGLMKENQSLQQKNSPFRQLSKRFAFTASLPQTNFQFLKKYYRQQQEKYMEVIQRYKDGQRQLQRKIIQLENSVQLQIKENNQMRQQLKANHHASKKHYELIKKEMNLRDQIFDLKQYNTKLKNKLNLSSPLVHDMSSQLDNSLKNERNSHHKAKTERLSTKQDQQERKLSKSVHNPSTINKNTNTYQRHTNLYPCKPNNIHGLDYCDENENRQNIPYKQYSKKWVLSESRPVWMEYMGDKVSTRIDNNLLRAQTTRKLTKPLRSITSLVQSKSKE